MARGLMARWAARARSLWTSPAEGDKHDAEMAFWRERQRIEGQLTGPHYRDIVTAHGMALEEFAGQRVLDIGCGPRGSLEWAAQARVRVGLDPLVDAYRELGIADHEMRYVASGAEAMPFADGSFDVVASLNSLDHVDDLERTIAEITRVVAPGGSLLLTTEVNHEPTATEPITFGFDVLELFQPAFRVADRWDFEMVHELVHASVLAAVPYDHEDPSRRSGILRARLLRAT